MIPGNFPTDSTSFFVKPPTESASEPTLQTRLDVLADCAFKNSSSPETPLSKKRKRKITAESLKKAKLKDIDKRFQEKVLQASELDLQIDDLRQKNMIQRDTNAAKRTILKDLQYEAVFLHNQFKMYSRETQILSDHIATFSEKNVELSREVSFLKLENQRTQSSFRDLASAKIELSRHLILGESLKLCVLEDIQAISHESTEQVNELWQLEEIRLNERYMAERIAINLRSISALNNP